MTSRLCNHFLMSASLGRSFNEDFSSHEEVLSIEGAHVATVKKVAWRPGGDEMVLASCGLDHAVKVNRITSI